MSLNRKLIIRSGALAGSERIIDRDLLRIGRDPANDFSINDIEISRNHAKITCVGDICKIEDLNSTNGTFLNGKKIIRPEVLKDGDLVSLGENNVFEISIEKKIDFIEPTPADDEKEKKIADKSFLAKKRHEEVINDNEISVTNETKNKNILQKFSKLPTWAMVLLIALIFLILFCLIPLIFIEITDQWCNLFSGFFNAISPGTCP